MINSLGFIDGIDIIFSEKLRKKNIQTPTAIQKLVIPYILNGQSIMFRSQTGTGKTFAYLLPVLQNIIKDRCDTNHCRVLVIAPTLELCSQIKTEIDFLLDGLEIDGCLAHEMLKPQLISGSGNIDRQIEGIKKNRPAVITANMGRLLQLLHMKKLRLNKVEYIIFDEADRLIAEECSGEIEELLRNVNPDAVKIACSATLSPKNRLRLTSLLGDINVCESDEQEILRNSILHWALWAEERGKIDALRSFLSAARPKKALVFSDRASSVDEIVSKLNHHKYSAAGIYSGMEKKERKNALDDFRSGKVPVLISSDIAARGLDIENITHVITMNVSQDAEVYIHRAGRTARAGKKGVMISIGSEKDLRYLRCIEKKLGLVVYPKILYKGRICSPEEFE
ncbi:MAG: DEAD/DEAH box helicase [Spirochaetaceae bacterium]|jgi:superfamily II DNA/RNA helicase|nr:DEAD/DEAH box helicase [Spirochaetaceae bacterium]